MTRRKAEVPLEVHEAMLLRQRIRRRNGYRGPNEVPRHKRLTVADRRRKIAQQFIRRSRHPSMKAQLGTREYWAIYNQRLEQQESRCAICGRDEPGGRGGWHMDHNEKTGTIRGLLCCSCNLKLGWVEANLKPIVRYLRRWSTL